MYRHYILQQDYHSFKIARRVLIMNYPPPPPRISEAEKLDGVYMKLRRAHKSETQNFLHVLLS
jgi:hypothetical protein